MKHVKMKKEVMKIKSNRNREWFTEKKMTKIRKNKTRNIKKHIETYKEFPTKDWYCLLNGCDKCWWERDFSSGRPCKWHVI
jgi:hypothetical protein